MRQMSFSDFEYAGKRKQTRRERFLAEVNQVVPWTGLLGLIEPFYCVLLTVQKFGDPFPRCFRRSAAGRCTQSQQHCSYGQPSRLPPWF